MHFTGASEPETYAIYTDEIFKWNDEMLNAAFDRDEESGLLSVYIVLAQESEGYAPGTLFEIATDYSGVEESVLKKFAHNDYVLIKNFGFNEGLLEVLQNAKIVGEVSEKVQISADNYLCKCRVLLDMGVLKNKNT